MPLKTHYNTPSKNPSENLSAKHFLEFERNPSLKCVLSYDPLGVHAIQANDWEKIRPDGKCYRRAPVAEVAAKSCRRFLLTRKQRLRWEDPVTNHSHRNDIRTMPNGLAQLKEGGRNVPRSKNLARIAPWKPFLETLRKWFLRRSREGNSGDF